MKAQRARELVGVRERRLAAINPYLTSASVYTITMGHLSARAQSHRITGNQCAPTTRPTPNYLGGAKQLNARRRANARDFQMSTMRIDLICTYEGSHCIMHLHPIKE